MKTRDKLESIMCTPDGDIVGVGKGILREVLAEISELEADLAERDEEIARLNKIIDGLTGHIECGTTQEWAKKIERNHPGYAQEAERE